MGKKAPYPERYWDQQYQRLAKESENLFRAVHEYRFQFWDGASIAEQSRLAKSLIAVLGNPYDYALSTFVDGLRKAMFRYKRAERYETLVRELREQTVCEVTQCTKRRKGIHRFELDYSNRLRRGLTGSVELYYCAMCNGRRWKLLDHCSICGQAMNQCGKPKTLDCGGDCKRCMDEAEGVTR